MAGDASDLEKKIIKQVEYYFGDSNLPRDRFLQEEVRKDEGWVPLDTMIKFNRLKQMSDDVKVICESLKKSTTGLLEINEEGLKIRRSPDKPIPENTEQRRHDQSARTVYAKEFPLDVSLDEVQEFFEKFGEVESVYLRKDEKKNFKGSVFTTYKKDEGVQAFLNAESPKFKDKELESRKTKSKYYKDKAEEKKQLSHEKDKKRESAKVRQEEDGKKKIENQLVQGAMLHLAGITGETSREDIKNLLQDHGPIAWVEFNRGETEALVRYDQENQAKTVLEKVMKATDGDIKLNEAKIEARVLEGDEEKEKWVKMYEDMKERRFSKNRRNKPYQRYGGSKKPGKRPCRGKREAERAAANGDGQGDSGADSGNDEPPTKQIKSEEKSDVTTEAAKEAKQTKSEDKSEVKMESAEKTKVEAAGE